MTKILILTLLALGCQSASAVTLTESFGSRDNAFTMDFVTIGNANNAADMTGSPIPAGSVAYIYNIGKYEVSRGQIDKANSAGSLGITMYNLVPNGGSGSDRPASGINWFGAATYVNWLNTSTGGTAAYKFVGGTFQLWSPTDAGYNASNMFRNSLAKYVLPSTDEWYKSAYGSPIGSWYDFPNGTNTAPVPVPNGTTGAVYGGQNTSADITNAGALSAYGTMAQGGNVWEWNETAWDGSNNAADEKRGLRGASWDYWEVSAGDMNAGYFAAISPSEVWDNSMGFRVASVSVPEPSTGLLVALGLSGLLLKRRKTGTL